MIKEIYDENIKKQIASDVLCDLPEWFGIEESTYMYIEGSATMPFWAWYEDEESVGFISLKETSKATAEIFVVGVKKKFQGKSIGNKLFTTFQDYARMQGYHFIQVKTVEKTRYPEYDRTRLFYEAMGFYELEVFPTLWDENNPCSIMIKSIG